MALMFALPLHPSCQHVTPHLQADMMTKHIKYIVKQGRQRHLRINIFVLIKESKIRLQALGKMRTLPRCPGVILVPRLFLGETGDAGPIHVLEVS